MQAIDVMHLKPIQWLSLTFTGRYSPLVSRFLPLTVSTTIIQLGTLCGLVQWINLLTLRIQQSSGYS